MHENVEVGDTFEARTILGPVLGKVTEIDEDYNLTIIHWGDGVVDAYEDIFLAEFRRVGKARS